MIRTKLFMACALAFAVSLAGTPAAAQQPTNQLTYFTFSAPFELPGGKTLPAGKYVFRVMDSPSNRHIIHVMSEDQREMHATLMAIPAQRMEAADEPEVRFMEAEANVAPAIRTWWYPGRTIGHEFTTCQRRSSTSPGTSVHLYARLRPDEFCARRHDVQTSSGGERRGRPAADREDARRIPGAEIRQPSRRGAPYVLS